MYDKWDQSYLSVQGQSDAHDATYMQQYTIVFFIVISMRPRETTQEF